jgi:hypothetical protein
MSSSLLYHAFVLKGVEFQSTKFVGSAIILPAKMNDNFFVPSSYEFFNLVQRKT